MEAKNKSLLLPAQLKGRYQVFVVHVAKFKERARSIEQQMQEQDISFQYVLEGDVEDIDETTLSRYFKAGCDDMYHAQPATSCALKHFYVYEHIVNRQLDGALVLEDDAIVDKDFRPKLLLSLKEYESRFFSVPVIVSYENSSLQFVPRSQRRKGVMLYEAPKDRFTGGYFINRKAAETILEDVTRNRCELAIDGYHNRLLHEKKLTYLWCHPTIVQQGTCIGHFASSLSSDAWMLRFRWLCKLYYKQLLYNLR